MEYESLPVMEMLLLRRFSGSLKKAFKASEVCFLAAAVPLAFCIKPMQLNPLYFEVGYECLSTKFIKVKYWKFPKVLNLKIWTLIAATL